MIVSGSFRMTYKDAIAWLESLQLFGAKPGLERTRHLAAALGHPERRLRFIHVAGTNGKGSTCAMLESIYRQAGWRVGLFTSPHLVAFAERIQVNRAMIPEAEVVRLVELLQPLAAALAGGDHPTFFEVVTLMALQYFAEQKCDLIIWETGLGGRLDATNIVTPLASIVTNIDYDHQKWLGYTLAEIAAEKSGILKPGVPAVTAADAPEALEVITARAREVGAPLTLVAPGEARQGLAGKVSLPLAGAHQRRNAATAVAVTRVLQAQLPVTEAQVTAGLEGVYWPGRMQRFRRGGQEFILDGAHNPAGMAALVQSLAAEWSGRRPTAILGILSDKDWAQMCGRLAPAAGRLLLVNVHSERTTEAAELRAACTAANPGISVSCHAHLAEALAVMADEPLVVITGSLYLVGEAMELLHLSPIPSAGRERHLNEWGGPPPAPVV
jgi:dihydrofolate synthase/folylpolyglutamate synthase